MQIMAKKHCANTKKKRKAPPTAWKPGQSGNPKGRPKDGESWAGSLKWAFNLTGKQAAEIAPPELAREFKKLGKMELRRALCLRMAAALLFDPTASLFTSIADREEGRLPQTVNQNINWREDIERLGINPDEVLNEARKFIEAAEARRVGSDHAGGVGES